MEALKAIKHNVILYHKSNLVYIVVFPQFLIFQQNNSAQTSVLICFTSRHYYFFEKLKIVEKERPAIERPGLESQRRVERDLFFHRNFEFLISLKIVSQYDVNSEFN